MVTVVPTFAIAGLNDVMEGAVADVVTLNETLLVAEPFGVITAIGPVVVPIGTVTANWLLVAKDAVVLAPENVTASCCAFTLNEVPEIVITVPIGPLLGVKSRTDT